MGSESLPTRADSQTIDQNWFNTIKSILAVDLFPRTISGVVTTLVGSLGSATFQWLNIYSRKAEIDTGYWNAGDIKSHLTYNNLVPVGQGWMLCNGQIINETNYNSTHGAGSWATYIGTSLLDGKYTPDMDERYLRGEGTTSQTGVGAYTYQGNAGNTIDIQHSHGSGTFTALIDDTANMKWKMTTGNTAWQATHIQTITGYSSDSTSGLTDGVDIQGSSSAAGSLTQSISPDSLDVQFWIRII